MAAGNPQAYGQFLLNCLNNTSDWVNDNHYAILLTSSHTFTITHTTLADISANEIADYDTSGPQDMTGEALSGAAGTVTFDADPVDFGNNVTITARYIAYLEGTVGAKSGTDKLCFSAALDDTADKSSSNGDFDVDFNASGACTVTQTS